MTFQQKIQYLLESNTDFWPKLIGLFIQSLIFLSLICFTVETLPDLSPLTLQILNITEIFTVIVFTLEYCLRIYAAPRKRDFIFSVSGIIDLLAILPFYLPTSIDLRTLRILRLLRLVRIFKMVRYNKALHRFKRALIIAREELILFWVIALITLYISSVGIYYFEHEAQPEAFASIFHCFWWALITLTTVGYGDMYPVTAGGQFFTFFVLMIGLGVIAVPTGLITSALNQAREEEKLHGSKQEPHQ